MDIIKRYILQDLEVSLTSYPIFISDPTEILDPGLAEDHLIVEADTDDPMLGKVLVRNLYETPISILDFMSPNSELPSGSSLIANSENDISSAEQSRSGEESSTSDVSRPSPPPEEKPKRYTADGKVLKSHHFTPHF